MTSDYSNKYTLDYHMSKNYCWINFDLSDKKDMLKNIYQDITENNSKIYHTHLSVEHDGYDSYGPKSELLTLCVWGVDNTVKLPFIKVYYTEQWYCEKPIYYEKTDQYHFTDISLWKNTINMMPSSLNRENQQKKSWQNAYDLIDWCKTRTNLIGDGIVSVELTQ